MSEKQETMRIKMRGRGFQGVELGPEMQKEFRLPAWLEPREMYTVPVVLGERLTAGEAYEAFAKALRTRKKKSGEGDEGGKGDEQE